MKTITSQSLSVQTADTKTAYVVITFFRLRVSLPVNTISTTCIYSSSPRFTAQSYHTAQAATVSSHSHRGFQG